MFLASISILNNRCQNKSINNSSINVSNKMQNVSQAIACDKTSFGSELPKNFGTVVYRKLYRGALPSVENFSALKKQGVTFVIDLCGANSNESKIANENGMTYIYQDGFRFNKFKKLVSEIQEKIKNGEVGYIHCEEGQTRTGTLVAYYQRLIEGKSDDKIIDGYVKHGGNDIVLAPVLQLMPKTL